MIELTRGKMWLQLGLHCLQQESTTCVAFSTVDLVIDYCGSFTLTVVSTTDSAQVAAITDFGLKV